MMTAAYADCREYVIERVGAEPARASSNTATTVIEVDLTARPPLPQGYLPVARWIDDMQAADPELASAMAEARKARSRSCESVNLSLTKLRLAAGLSQSQLAAAVGSTQANISRIEAGTQDPRVPMIKKLRHALNVDWDTLLDALDRG